jgi:hypothetical protein
MATTRNSTNNPLTLTVSENITVRAVFKPVSLDEPIITLSSPPPVQENRWRDCVSGELRTGTIPSNYIQVPYTGAGGGTCWEPATIIGFEPTLEDVLNFDWRRGGTSYPEPKTFKITNPSATLSFDVTITTNPKVIITPPSFRIAPRSSQNVIVAPSPALLNDLGDGISNIDFKIELIEVI